MVYDKKRTSKVKGEKTMDLSTKLLSQIAAMVMVTLLGVVFIRAHMLKEKDSQVLSKIILYGANPCILFNSFNMDYDREKALGFAAGLIAAAVVYAVFILVERILKKTVNPDPIERVSIILTNAGYILIPLVAAVLGSEYVFYCCSFLVVQTLVIWTYVLVDLGQGHMVSLKKVALNPNIIAIAAGLIVFFAKIPVPDVIQSACTTLGNATGGLSMLVIGLAIGGMKIKDIFSNGKAYVVCAERLILYPVIIVILIWASHICDVFPFVQKAMLCTVLASAAPCGVLVTQFAELFGLDAEKSGVICILSTFFCIITIPAMVLLFQVLCTS